MRRWIAAVCMVAMLVGGLALPAAAVVSKSGSLNCGGNNVAVRSLATHTVTHYAPSSTQIGQWNNGSEFRTRTSVTQLQSTSWKVTSTGSLNSPGTYAFCWGN